MNDKPELLAPCGNEENFYAAINFGADAVYLGLSDFSARKNASNFSVEKLPFFTAYAHLFGVSVYVAVNTLVKDNELNDFFGLIDKAQKCGADAFIVQDLFLGRTLKKMFPDITLHLSTQAGINNLYGAKIASAYGFKRVILARETNIDDIKKISAIIETEVFVQGALCTCFSGHCYMSSFIGGNSGNRGFCRQPCRKKYYYSDAEGEKNRYRYALSLSDLCLADKLDVLVKSGVKSFKIEGRMRSFEYTCAACDLYRKLIDGANPTFEYENLKRTYNRGGYTEGLGFGSQKNLISDKIQNHAGSVVGKVCFADGKIIRVDGKYHFKDGDCFKIISGGVETGNGVALTSGDSVKLAYRGSVLVGDEVALTKDYSLTENYKRRKKLFPVQAKFYCHENENIKLTVNGREYVSDYVAVPAITSAVTSRELKENARKTDVYPFDVTPSSDIDKVFIPKKIINELRARAYREYFYSFMNTNVIVNNIVDYKLDFKDYYVSRKELSAQNETAVIVGDAKTFIPPETKKIIYCPSDYSDFDDIHCFLLSAKSRGAESYLYLPPFFSGEDEPIFNKAVDKFDGIYCESAFGIFYAKKLCKKIFCGIENNITNQLSYSALCDEGVGSICLSKELNEEEIRCFGGNSFVFSLGCIKVMSLEYCPFGMDCKNCKRGNIFYLTDEDGRKFPVRRYRMSSCRFEIYNESYLVAKIRHDKEIFDFTVCLDTAEKLIDARDGKGVRNFKITTGNLVRGVN